MTKGQALALTGAGVAAAAGAGYWYWRRRQAEEARRRQQEAFQQLQVQQAPTIGQIGQQLGQAVGQTVGERIAQTIAGWFGGGKQSPQVTSYEVGAYMAAIRAEDPVTYGAALAVEWYETGAPVQLLNRLEAEGFETGAIPLLAAAAPVLTQAIGTFLTANGPSLGAAVAGLIQNCREPWAAGRAYRQKLAQANATLGGKIPGSRSRARPGGVSTRTATATATATQVGVPAMAGFTLPFDQEVVVRYSVKGTASRCGQQVGLVKILGSPDGKAVKEFFAREAEGVAKLFSPETHSDSREVRLKLPAGSYILQAAKTDSAEASITVTYEDLPAAAVGRLALPTSLRRALPIALGVAGVAGLGVVAYRYARRRMG